MQLNQSASKQSHKPQDAGDKIESLRILVRELSHEVETLTISEAVRARPSHFYEEVKRYEIELIRNALKITGGNQKEAAELLRILPTTLNSKIKRYHIDSTAFRRHVRAHSLDGNDALRS